MAMIGIYHVYSIKTKVTLHMVVCTHKARVTCMCVCVQGPLGLQNEVKTGLANP